MGMAASQARFLGLTARKNNVEYEGQQINQQRTTLGNQSANYYNNLLGMSVPVPPSVQDYTKTVYTFQDGNLNNSITSLVAQQNGEYKVSYVSSWQNDFTPVANGAAVIFHDDEYFKNIIGHDQTDLGAYMVGNNVLKPLGTNNMVVTWIGVQESYEYKLISTDPNGVETYEYLGDPNNHAYAKDGQMYNDAALTQPFYGTKGVDYTVKYVSNDEYFQTLTGEQRAKLLEQENDYKAMLNKKYNGDDQSGEWFVRYVQNTTSGVYEPIFYSEKIVRTAQYDDGNTGASQSNIPSYKMGSAAETEEVKGVKARLEKDATGRYINITLMPNDDVELTYALTTSTITDQDAYNDAMNQYEFDKATYDQAIQEINAKIEIVQAEDRNLELRLKQLDTEQDAIQTEMEAVEKVINKNTESTFKTFG